MAPGAFQTQHHIFAMYRRSVPSRLRFLTPFIYSLLPVLGAFFWLHVTGIVTAMAHAPEPTLPNGIFYFVAASPFVGLLASAYWFWADFIRGDYYLETQT